MRILIAPDKFKGSLSAAEAASAIAEGVLRVYPDAIVTQFPVADGGEGTLEAAIAAGYEEKLSAVVGPILKPTGAAWALRTDAFGTSTAIVETSQASGLALVDEGMLDASGKPTPEAALRAHSYGCGQLIASALDAGATEIVLGLGGSAMSDGGSGALRALGLKPLDASGNVVPLGGGSLIDVVSVDTSALDPRLSAVKIRLAVDVQHPIFGGGRTGSEGAAHVFGPQKGADEDGVELLDAGLRNWASVIRQATGRDVNVPGAGAAGGFPAAFLGFSNATLEEGFGLVASLTGLAPVLAEADLVITGEGSLDAQSLEGKAPIALADAASGRGIPVLAVAGRILVTPEELAEHGIDAAVQLLDLAPSPAAAQSEAAKYLTLATQQVLEGA
ncbi:glycerate kinase [Pseudarthrobacter sp. J1738]|uniref:glycerate kinase n=1 Tax=unclassified Pseudarthrobacter TaxID=2647000 RepID=UPI003D2DA351